MRIVSMCLFGFAAVGSRAGHFALIGVMAAAFPAFAQDAGDTTQGRHLAEAWCSSCHIVVPTAQQGSNNGAPPFAAVARMPSTTLMSLNAFLRSSHPPMPDLKLSAGQIDDVAAYTSALIS
jgi:cytochrome c